MEFYGVRVSIDGDEIVTVETQANSVGDAAMLAALDHIRMAMDNGMDAPRKVTFERLGHSVRVTTDLGDGVGEIAIFETVQQ